MQTIWGNLPTFEEIMSNQVGSEVNELNYENTIKLFGLIQQISETPEGDLLEDEAFDAVTVRAYMESKSNSEIAERTHKAGGSNPNRIPKVLLDRLPDNYKQRILNTVMVTIVLKTIAKYNTQSIEELAEKLGVR